MRFLTIDRGSALWLNLEAAFTNPDIRTVRISTDEQEVHDERGYDGTREAKIKVNGGIWSLPISGEKGSAL